MRKPKMGVLRAEIAVSAQFHARNHTHFLLVYSLDNDIGFPMSLSKLQQRT
jgi:hypothetical protein